MATRITIRHGVAKPLPVRIQAGASGVDMNTVESVSFRVRGSASADWPAVLSARSTTELTATKLVSGGECPIVGNYMVTPMLTITGQSWPEEANSFNLKVIQ